MRRIAAQSPCRAHGRTLAALGLLLGMAACAPRSDASQAFVVYFQEWSAALDDSAVSAVSTAAKWANDHPTASVEVVGYADPDGSKQANIDISRTRAQVVIDQLVQDGVNAQRISKRAAGPTDFTLSSLESRRVEISIAGY